ncbi:hypothetical protein B0J17DRAFT_46464 [Rhizoctonia solani]|nr:hypothetical protein B0J17DRAFT_46464 [Rhizoctonia solani]
MFDELDADESLLQSALETYRNACSEVEYYCRENALGGAASDRIVRGLVLHETFNTTLTKAKASLRYSRNASRYILPINSLPPEILVYILSLAMTFSHEACELHNTPYCSNCIHLQPIDFTSVCVYWRNLILQGPTLWPRIDIVHIRKLAQWTIPHAKVRVEHSGLFPLDIRVAVKSYELIEKISLDFLTSLANRSLGSLSFILQGVDDNKEDAFFNSHLSI